MSTNHVHLFFTHAHIYIYIEKCHTTTKKKPTSDHVHCFHSTIFVNILFEWTYSLVCTQEAGYIANTWVYNTTCTVRLTCTHPLFFVSIAVCVDVCAHIHMYMYIYVYICVCVCVDTALSQPGPNGCDTPSPTTPHHRISTALPFRLS